MAQKKKGKIGSSFDGFLAEEGILETCEEQALKQILADQIKAAMEKDNLTKSAMAQRMQTSRRALDRLLDPKNTGVTQQQAQELAQESTWLFDQIGIGPGSRVVEIGCGPQGCLELLSDRVGAEGYVIGVELSELAVATARGFLADRGITNAEVRQGHGAATGLETQSFDFATARLVLVNIPEPEKIVAEMAALVKPGGVVALHEADWIAHLCDPAFPEWDRLMQALVTYSKENGIDLYIGRRIARMLRAAGLTDIRLNPLASSRLRARSQPPTDLSAICP